MKRVAVTGVGLVTSLGLNVQANWQALVAGQSGVRRITTYDPTGEKVCVAAQLPQEQFEVLDEALPSDMRDRSARFVHLVVVAAAEALLQAGNPQRENSPDYGVTAGVGFGEPQPSTGFKVGPTSIIHAMPNGAAAWISILYGLRGPNMVCHTACASGAHAIGIAFDQIRLGRAKGMLAGGVDTVVTRDVMRSFGWMRALNSERDCDPTKMSRPFDATRRGFVMGEGAGMMMLEDWDIATARGATILAEMLGWGASADGHHIVAVAPEGVGMQSAMRRALVDACVEPQMIDYVSAHGTGTKMNDKEETTALRQVFGPHAAHLAVSSQKSMLGHTMGAAGAIEAIVTVLSIADQIATPTLNLRNPDPDCDLDYVPLIARKMPIRIAISNSFGFGGHNSTLVFGRV